jgi:uncharacterized NAD(P)/FAD-binding protein YdhS
MQKIVIVGGGLSGSLLTINLLKLHSNRSMAITVIDKNLPNTLGVAYSTDKKFHLLNVPAGKMSAFPDKADDFTVWLTAAGFPWQTGSFVPRQVYKAYIHDRLSTAVKSKGEGLRYESLNDEVTDILPSEQLLILRSGKHVAFDKLILALGNFRPANLPLADNRYLDHPCYYSSAWEQRLFDRLSDDAGVLLVGTGLTMVDVALTLRERRHRGNIIAISTHGFTPLAHGDSVPYQIAGIQNRGIDTALDALRMVNRQLKEARQQGIGWHSVIDAIRPYTQQIWMGLPAEEKKRFMEHLRHRWGVARHRIPRESAALLYELLSLGQLTIAAGRIRTIDIEMNKGFLISYLERSTGRTAPIRAAAIVNCMGPQSDYEKLDDPLIRSLLDKELIRPDELHLGIDCGSDGAVLGKDGLPSPWLYTIGPPARGCLWEITSVPEIRIAAARLAETVSSPRDALIL